MIANNLSSSIRLWKSFVFLRPTFIRINQKCCGHSATSPSPENMISGLYSSCSLSSSDPMELAQYLINRIVAVSEHFVVLDKPPGLPVLQKSLPREQARESIMGHQPKQACLCVKDCLPQLAYLLNEKKECNLKFCSDLTSGTPCDGYQPTLFRPYKGSNKSVDSNSFPQLFIAEPLPAPYSGLILLARTESYAESARRFYRTAKLTKTAWSMYQQLLAVCCGKPYQPISEEIVFPTATYQVNKLVSVAYRPRQEEISRKKRLDGTVLLKRVSHRSLADNSLDASLVELTTNSNYRALPELYLLHQGCSVVGELLQSSRLVQTGMAPVLLHPSKATILTELPVDLRRRLGHPQLRWVPVHLHRSRLFLPAPAGDSENVKIHSVLKRPLGTIFKQTDTETECLSWTSLHHSEPNECAKHSSVILTARSPFLPIYFEHTMNRLGLNYNYSNI